MTKADIWKNTKAILEEHGATRELTAALASVLRPQRSGGPLDIDSVTKKDEDGVITHIECSLSGVYLPATEDYFPIDKDGKGIEGLKRASIQATQIAKEHKKTVDASVKAITADLFAGKIDNVDAQEQVTALKASEPDYSSVSE